MNRAHEASAISPPNPHPHPQPPQPQPQPLNPRRRRRHPHPAPPIPYLGHFGVKQALAHYITNPTPSNRTLDPNAPHWTDIPPQPRPPHRRHTRQGQRAKPFHLVLRLSGIPGALHPDNPRTPYNPLMHAQTIARAFGATDADIDGADEPALKERNALSWARKLGASEVEIEAARAKEGGGGLKGLEELARAKMLGPERKKAGMPRLGSWEAAAIGVPGTRVSFC